MVSTIKEQSHYGKKMMIVEYLNTELKPIGKRAIALDAVDAGIGDIVLVAIDGGAATMMFGDRSLIMDQTICGVLEQFSVGGKVVKVGGG